MKLRIRDGRVDLDPESVRLTDAQQRALQIGVEIAVTAGAGAGKTHTLATRYVALFLELAQRGEPEIDQVAVLTFTEKAAAEMSERCYARLVALTAAARAARDDLDRLDGPSGAPLGGHLCAALDRLCDRFDGARIGTFHGFCATVLREFPVESHTGLDTVLIEPVEALALGREALEDTLLEHLRADPDGFGRLLDALGSRARLVEAGQTALWRRYELDQALEAHATGTRTVRERIDDQPLDPEAIAQWLQTVGHPTLRAVHRLAESGSSPFTRQLEPLLAALAAARPSDPTDAILHANALYARCLEALLSGPDKVRTLTHPSVIGAKAGWPDPHRYTRAKQALGVLQERVTDWPERAQAASELPTRADATLYAVLGPFARWVLAAAARFRDALATRGAIDFSEMQHRAVAAVLAHDEVRQALARRHRYLVVDEFQDTDARQWDLVRAIGRPKGVPSDRIFLVGDAKQAIYGFRGGDVTVFESATAELGVDPLLLPHNFRSRPELIDWFNQVFPDVLEGVPYAPLLPGRPDGGGTVTAVLGERDGPGDPEATAHLIAAEILAGAAPWAELGLGNRTRHPTPPIAVLLRRRTNLSAYEDALRARGIPYAVAQGVGFWSRPEVVDLVNALHGLATGDPASVVGALRSPLFGLTDQAISDLGRGIRALHREDPAAYRPEIAGAIERWRALRKLSRTTPPSGLLRALVDLARPLWHDRTELSAGRAEANGHRLVELSQPFDARGGLHRCASAFLGQVLAGSRESEAVLAPDAARVILLTIHAAKGLEFPVVLVPEIDVPPRGASDALAIGRPRGTWELAFAVADEESEVQQRTRPGLLSAVQRAARTEADAEYTRLLYVAATRARDHLILLGNHPRATPGVRASWIDRLAPLLSASTRVRDREAVLALPLPPAAASSAQPPAPVRPRPAVAVDSVELGASSLDAFADCPARWYRRDRLGLPEHGRRGEERARALAGIRGQVIHGLLEDDAADDLELARRRWSAAVLDAGGTAAEVLDGQTRLAHHLHVATESPALRAALAAPGHSEIGFRVSRGPVVLRGQIDRLYCAPDGWVVLDYKTEAVVGPASPDRHRLQLLAYAWAADGILVANGQAGVVRAEVLYTASGEVVALPWDTTARAELEGLLDALARVAQLPWSAVEREARSATEPRPCSRCGFFARGCAGATSPGP